MTLTKGPQDNTVPAMLTVWLAFAFLVILFITAIVFLTLMFQKQMTQHQLNSNTTYQTIGDKLENSQGLTRTLLEQMQDRIDAKLKEAASLVQNTHQTVGDRLDKNYELFGKVQERLGKIEQTSLDIKSVGKDISELQNLFKAPKLRGNLGEHGLEQILSQVIPKAHYEMQHMFSSGVKVDAVIKLSAGLLVPIDAKFPYENFKRMMTEGISDLELASYKKSFQGDLKKHIDDISNKYILPNEKTLDFALMYIPAEHVYYEAILKDDRFGEHTSLHHYALQKRVIPVSPNSIYAYLQAIAMGLKGLRIEESAKEIFTLLEKFKLDLAKLAEDISKAGKHLSHAQASFEACEKRVDRVQSRLENVHDTPLLAATAPEDV